MIEEGLNIVNALALGILEGLTEFIPVSSTGHLIILGNAIGAKNNTVKVFEVFIQLGAILAALLLYIRYFLNLVFPSQYSTNNSNTKNSFSGVQGIIKLLLTMLPASILGFLFHGVIKEFLFNPRSVAFALIVGGIMLILIEYQKKDAAITSIEQVSYLNSFLVGCFQCLSLWPGMSRSGSTIIGARLLGFERVTAAEFSFIIAVPIMFAAVGWDIIKNLSILSFSHIGIFAFGFFVSFITAVFAIKFCLKILQHYTFAAFGWYRIILGSIVLLLAM